MPIAPRFLFIDHLRWGEADQSRSEGTGSHFLGVWGGVGLCVAGGPSLQRLAWSEAGFGWRWVRATNGVHGNEVAWVVGTLGGGGYTCGHPVARVSTTQVPALPDLSEAALHPPSPAALPSSPGAVCAGKLGSRSGSL